MTTGGGPPSPRPAPVEGVARQPPSTLLGVFWLRALVALAAAAVLVKMGFVMLGGLARPVPGPPPAGELRKVRLAYRCSICATEVRMTAANDQVPEAPRHCMEDMELVTPVDDL